MDVNAKYKDNFIWMIYEKSHQFENFKAMINCNIINLYYF
jgi:hypothetical protein